MIDFELDQKPRKRAPIGVMNLLLISLVIAILAIVCWATKIQAGAVVFGAVGLVLGGYCMGFVHKHGNPESSNKLFGIAAVILLLSVFSFMLGFVGLCDGL